ncbi:MAG: dihydroneopterin aldolase [Bacteroidota bacterium]|nr:dihydroneopterin aldolase [Bacteroidota bacterium]MDP4217727.1 dihydroneopterin aldolase [Bacteroidota bacterium]MDP4247720.1 dihydroneopterin aldolase [Bacteroidota bacterium]MDP4253712.1 dihydroneopterin aldolase [Bacteroidota bacterium]MDP4259668.1 dihydroneopterin aldolase [Bacteroidota bacterium]
MVTVQLHNLIFSAHHGVSELELMTGNTFEVSLDVFYDDARRAFNTLEGTVNYVRLYDIVQENMRRPSRLLEKIGAGIVQQIKEEFPFISEAVVTIYKLQAPIGNFQGRAGITYRKSFE